MKLVFDYRNLWLNIFYQQIKLVYLKLILLAKILIKRYQINYDLFIYKNL